MLFLAFFGTFVAPVAHAASTVTLNTATTITNGMRLCASGGNHCVNITRNPSSTASASFTNAPPNIGGSGVSGESDDLVILDNDTSTSPRPFSLDVVNIGDIDSLTNGGGSDEGLRDAYAWSVPGTWTLSGSVRDAVVSTKTGGDRVVGFLLIDPDGGNNITDIGDFNPLPTGTSPVLLNMDGDADNHNATFTFATPTTSATLYAFNSGGGSMLWSFTPSMTVTLKDPKLTLTKTVVNTGGGTATAGDFTLSFTDGGTNTGSGVSGAAAVTGVSVGVGDYTLSESGPAGYDQALSCTGAADTVLTNGLSLALDETVSCAFTNTFAPAPELTATKSPGTPTIPGGSITTLTDVGDTITYTVTIENTGNNAISGVSPSDSGPKFGAVT